MEIPLCRNGVEAQCHMDRQPNLDWIFMVIVCFALQSYGFNLTWYEKVRRVRFENFLLSYPNVFKVISEV